VVLSLSYHLLVLGFATSIKHMRQCLSEGEYKRKTLITRKCLMRAVLSPTWWMRRTLMPPTTQLRISLLSSIKLQ
jgi:hypothetical protein